MGGGRVGCDGEAEWRDFASLGDMGEEERRRFEGVGFMATPLSAMTSVAQDATPGGKSKLTGSPSPGCTPRSLLPISTRRSDGMLCDVVSTWETAVRPYLMLIEIAVENGTQV